MADDNRILLGSPVAHASISRDIVDDLDADVAILDDTDEDSDEDGTYISDPTMHMLSTSYSRPMIAGHLVGQRVSMVLGPHELERQMSRQEYSDVMNEERSLLRDNNLIPPKHPQEGDAANTLGAFFANLPVGIPGGDRKVVRTDEELAFFEANPDEETPLLGNPALPYGGLAAEDVKNRWGEAVAEGKIKTTWQRETKTLARYSAPLIVTFVLQYTLTLASVLVVGHIGVAELGAVSLAAMTANITGYAPYQGLGTALDTLCAQAYGAGKKKLVGLQMQRMIYFLWLITIPIAILWLFAEQILVQIVPEPEIARLAGQYLKIALIGAPGWAAFECGKRYMQAQGKFNVGLYVMLVAAPLNAFLNWFFVWKVGWGFIGAPIAVAIIGNVLPILLFLYVRFVDGAGCWPGFTRRAFHNWGPMIRLALPGLLMVESECLAFEILTLSSSYFGTKHLAAQSVLSTTVSLAWQIPFPLSIASSTRVANLIGATLTDAAKLSSKVGFTFAVAVGLLNLTLLSSLRKYIPLLFTSDAEVLDLVASALPICAAFQLFDALAAWGNGTLRGLGRQEIGGYVQLACYYGLAMPVSFGTAFGLGWGIRGLWTGVSIALGLVAVIEITFIARTNWQKSVEAAQKRNEDS